MRGRLFLLLLIYPPLEALAKGGAKLWQLNSTQPLYACNPSHSFRVPLTCSHLGGGGGKGGCV